MKATIELLVHTLGPVLYVLLLGGAALGLVVGVLLLVNSARVLRWNDLLNRWYSTRKAVRSLERPIDIKRPLYRWHRVVGIVVFAASLYTKLGIDPNQILHTTAGRPVPLVNQGRLIKELFS